MKLTNEQLLNHLYTDLCMLKDGSWEPDEDSINSSINSLEEIASNLNLSLKDIREQEDDLDNN